MEAFDPSYRQATPSGDALPSFFRSGLQRRAREGLPLWLTIGLMALMGAAFLSQTAVWVDGKLYFSLADDAMISMTYARNLSEGAGLVWAPNYTPVEGYTNPLWTVWMALIHVVTPDDRWAPLLAAASALVCLAAGLAAAARLGRLLRLSPASQLFALVSAGTLYAPIFWSLRGFEVGALVGLQGWMLALALDREDTSLRRDIVLGLLAATAFLTRMDSAVVTAAILGLRVVGFGRPHILGAAIATGMLVAAVVALFLVRIAYYGDLLPNTVYLKLEAVPLVTRLLAGVRAVYHTLLDWAPLVALACLPAVLAPRRDRAAERHEIRFAYFGVAFVVAIQFAYTVYVGGDAWEWSQFPDRFVSIVAFPLCVASGLGLGVVIERLKMGAMAAVGLASGAAALAFGWTSLGDWRDTLSGHGFQFAEEKYFIQAGLNLKSATPPGFTYGVSWAGTIPYYAEGRRPLDLLGKTDRTIAHMRPEPGVFKPGHNKYDLTYSLGQLRPDAMLQTPGDDIPPNSAEADQLRSWGYVLTPGGWWVQRSSAERLTDPRILAQRF